MYLRAYVHRLQLPVQLLRRLEPALRERLVGLALDHCGESVEFVGTVVVLRVLELAQQLAVGAVETLLEDAHARARLLPQPLKQLSHLRPQRA